MLVSILLSFVYFLFFIYLFYRFSFFEIAGFSRKYIVLVFAIKVLFGVVLIEIYSHFYTTRSAADAFKYYDDAKVIYATLWSHPLDYLRMTFGINSDALDLYPYYQKMNNWYLADSYTFYNDSRSVIRFNALVFPFAFGRYVVHMIFMCFLSLCGLVALFKAFMPFFKQRLASLAIAIFLVPSVLFWGSGVLKEGLILFASGYLIYYFFKLLNEDNKLQTSLYFFLFTGLMVLIKVHILISLVPGFCIVWWHMRKPQSSIYLKTAIAVFALFTLAFVVSFTKEERNPFYMLAQKQKDFVNLAKGGFYFEEQNNYKDTFYVEEKDRAKVLLSNDSVNWRLADGVKFYRWTKEELTDTFIQKNQQNSSYRLLMHLDSSGSRIYVPGIEPNVWSVVMSLPVALSNVLFRPFVFEAANYLSLFAALENLWICFFMLLMFLFFKVPKKEEQAIFIFCFSFVLILFSIIGLTTPVMGAIVRYKIPALPYLFLLFMLLTDAEKLRNKFPFLKKFNH